MFMAASDISCLFYFVVNLTNSGIDHPLCVACAAITLSEAEAHVLRLEHKANLTFSVG